jgi:serine/threonine protein kinase
MCHHPNIIRLYGVCDDPNNFAIVEQLCPHGSLLDVIKKIDEVPWYRVVGIARDATAVRLRAFCLVFYNRILTGCACEYVGCISSALRKFDSS